MRERAVRLHRICKAIERRRAQGVGVRKAVVQPAWFWRERHYRTAPRIKCRFARSTLVALYYQWRGSGQSPDCFVLHYAERLAPVTPDELRRFIRACAQAGTVSVRQAGRLAGFERARTNRILTRLPSRLVLRIERCFEERRQAELEAGAAAETFHRETRRLQEAERGRRSDLQKSAEASLREGPVL
jgi:hypothetical protein